MTAKAFNSLVPVQHGTLRLAVRIWTNSKHEEEFKLSNRVAIAWSGWLDNVGTFETLAPLLVEQLNMDIVCVDPPGNGWSEHWPASTMYHEHNEYILIGHVADALGIDTFVLIGHSRGGGICAMATAVFAARVRALVVFESGFGLHRDFEPDATTWPERVLLADQMFAKNRTRPLRIFKSVKEAIEFNATNETFPKSVITARNIVLRQLRPCKGGFTFTHDVRTYGQKQTIGLTEEQVKGFLRGITCPVLRIMRESAIFLPKPEQKGVLNVLQQQFRERSLCVRNLTDLTFPGKHHLHSDHAVEVAAIIVPWLEKHVDRVPVPPTSPIRTKTTGAKL